MELNETDKEIFDKIIQDFINEFGEELGHEIIKQVYSLHKEIRKNLGKKNIPVALIYRTLLSKKMNTPIDEGGYIGMELEDIAKAEDIPLRIVKDVYKKMYNSTGDNS